MEIDYEDDLAGARHRESDLVKAIDRHSKNVTKWLSIQNETNKAGFAAVVEALAKLNLPTPGPTIKGVKFMFVVKDDNPDVGYSVSIGDVTDAEGNVITDPQGLSVEVTSDNDAVVSLAPAPDGKSGTAHFGAPGSATITANVKDAAGAVLAAGAASFTVTTGDPAAVTGVTLAFDGLTEV